MEENAPMNSNENFSDDSSVENSLPVDDPSADYESQGENIVRPSGVEGDGRDPEPITMQTKKKKSHIREWTEAVIVAFVGVIILKSFFFEPFAIPSDSMSGTLLSGDYVVVNKMIFGARMPMTPLTIPFTHQSVFGMKSYSDAIQWDYTRMPGFGEIEHNDVIVFNFPAEELFPLDGQPRQDPIDHRTHFIKRCIGLPGDTIQIRNKTVYINSSELPAPVTAMFNYIIKVDSSRTDSLNLTSLGMVRESRQGKYIFYTITTKSSVADSLKLNPKIISVEPELSPPGSFDEQVFPHEERLSWNLDNYGPIVVPKEGNTIKLSVDSLSMWERIIVDYENNEMEVKGDSIFINGKYTNTYTFKMNYYFVMGDNRHFSMDSRYWGFVPEDHIVGVATMVLFSYDGINGGVRWGRTFSGIH